MSVDSTDRGSLFLADLAFMKSEDKGERALILNSVRDQPESREQYQAGSVVFSTAVTGTLKVAHFEIVKI